MMIGSKSLLTALAIALLPSGAMGISCCTDDACTDCVDGPAEDDAYQACYEMDRDYFSTALTTCGEIQLSYQGDCCSTLFFVSFCVHVVL